MAHQVESGVYRNEVPWMGLGNGRVLHRTDEEGELTIPIALEKSGLADWTVETFPAGVEVEPGKWMYLPDDRATVRVNSKARKNAALDKKYQPFKAVGTRYVPVQNEIGFQWLSRLLDDGDITIETAISLRGGRTVVIVARRPDGITIGDDEVIPYVNFVNGHDGATALMMYATPIRTVCANTLAFSLIDLNQSARQSYRVKHTRNADVKLEEARHALEISFDYTDTLSMLGDQMVHTKLTDADFQKFLDDLAPIPEAEGRGKTLRTRMQDEITKLYYEGENNRKINGTAWGALQATVEYNDHVKPVRNVDARFEQIMRGSDLNQHALNLLKPAA